MSLSSRIKDSAKKAGATIQTSEEQRLQTELNKLFYLDRKPKEELEFLKHIMTRGQETQERVGLHLSAMIESDKKYCMRQQVLSLIYKQRQGETVQIGLKRIFEEGNAIHEKWQRLFIRGGYSNAKMMDVSYLDDRYQVSFTPDIIARIPDFFDGTPFVVEIKSMNTYAFQKASSHPSGEKQANMYSYLKRIRNYVVLAEDKNNQDFKCFIRQFDPEKAKPTVERLKAVQVAKNEFLNEHKMCPRHDECKKVTNKKADECPMRDACFNVGMGRIKIGG